MSGEAISDMSDDESDVSIESGESSESDESIESGESSEDPVMMGASGPLTIPPFVGTSFVVSEKAVSAFHEAAFSQLADLLSPGVCPSFSKRGYIVLSVDEAGVIGIRDYRWMSIGKHAHGSGEIMYSVELVSDGGGSKLHKYGCRTASVATEWSGGFPVYWVLSESSRFLPTSELSFMVNHDFAVYDLPDKYTGMLMRNTRLECEAFSCEVMHLDGANRASLYPPKPTRSLRRPTDIGFNLTVETVDLLSARRFVRGVMETYASSADLKDKTWEDPLQAGKWNETRGKLVWLLLTLDQDDLLSCVSKEWWQKASSCSSPEDYVFESPDMPGFQLISLLLNAPWFLTANTLDTLRGTCVPFGATSGGSNAWWDCSMSKWKTRLGLRAFQGVHVLNKVHECDRTCDLKRLLRDAHPPTHRHHVDDEHTEFGECSVMECQVCGKRVEDHRVVLDDGGGQYHQGVNCKECGSEMLKYVGMCGKVKCKYPKCPLKGVDVKCTCSMIDLPERQREDTIDVVSAVISDLDEVASRVRGAMKKPLYVRKRAESDETPAKYMRHMVACVQKTIIASSSYSHALTITCKEENVDSPAGTFDTEDLQTEMVCETHMDNGKFVKDAYGALTMNARWNVVAFTRDAAVAEFDAGSETEVRSCEECNFGVCERKGDKYHCVACRRWRPVNKEVATVFPSKILADVDMTSTDVLRTYSHVGREISTNEFIEILLRGMTRRFF